MQVTLYVHTNLSNGKRYVGITAQKPESRWRKGRGYQRCALFYNAIQKYGWDGFSHEVIAVFDNMKDASDAEKSLIAEFKSNNDLYGYNLEAGGHDKGEIAMSTREKLRILGRRKHDAESVEKSAAAHRGLRHTDETRRKMSASQKAFWQTEEGRELARKRSTKVSKRVFCVTDDGEKITFDSIANAAKRVGVDASNISRACSGASSKCANMIWGYEMFPCGRCEK